MPELPEVEVVRAGLERWVAGRSVAGVEVLNDRAVRRHVAGRADFAAQLSGVALGSPQRRGKFLWLPFRDDDRALAVHLGMSGQLVLPEPDARDEAHLRVKVHFDDGARALRFVDQRTFGWMAVEPLVAGVGGRLVPMCAAHIAADPFESDYDADEVARRLRSRRTGVKAALLDQQLVSGIGNIYADESLWRVRRHWATPANRLRQTDARALLAAAADVMTEALAAGGTSFDSLYVNVNGSSGYFSRSLAAYGREGEPCLRCGTPLRREAFANRSSYRCPRCQRRSPGVAPGGP